MKGPLDATQPTNQSPITPITNYSIVKYKAGSPTAEGWTTMYLINKSMNDQHKHNSQSEELKQNRVKVQTSI